MTTAHKPTFHPAVGNANQGGYRYHTARMQFSSHDLPSHMTLKYRQIGQNSKEEVSERDLKAELSLREQLLADEAKSDRRRQGLIEAPADNESPTRMIGSHDDTDLKQAEDYDDADDSASSSGSDSSSEDEEDEEAELIRELERIKAEREHERLRKEKEAEEAQAIEDEQSVMRGNPLLASALGGAPTFSVKRRWDDDVVFKNQAADAPEKKKRFINDTIRNDFHVRFLHRYIH